MKFVKYHGAGNDFVIIDAREVELDLSRERIAAICHRRFGVGADGLMTLENDPAGQEFYMRYWNADGGESTMCGNGGRCISLFAHHLGIGGGVKYFNSSDGYHSALIVEADEHRGLVELGMIDVREVRDNGDGSYFAFTGSPHHVEFVEDVMAIDVFGRGNEIRRSARYAAMGGANVNFVQILGYGLLKVRTFERGVENETLACGTGVTAAAIVTSFANQTDCKRFTVDAMGGKLEVSFDREDTTFQKVLLSGGAEKVFEGNIL